MLKKKIREHAEEKAAKRAANMGDDGFKTRLSKVRQRYEETASDSRWFKPKPGVTTVRVLPPWGRSADGSFFLAGALHYGFKIGGRDRAIVCPSFSDKGRCPVCEFIDKLKSNGGEDLKEVADKLRRRKKYWVNLLVRPKEGSEAEPKVQIWGASQKFIDTVMEAFDEEDYGDITDPVEGHDIKVTRKGSGFTDTRYSFTVRPKPSKLGLENWKKEVHKLDEVVLEWMSEKEMESAIAKNYAEEAAEVGFRLSSKLKSKPKEAEPEEEDDDDDSDDDDE